MLNSFLDLDLNVIGQYQSIFKLEKHTAGHIYYPLETQQHYLGGWGIFFHLTVSIIPQPAPVPLESI